MEEITTQLNLDDDQRKIYNIILMKGCVSVSSVSVYLEMDPGHVEKTIEVLEKKHLIRKASGIIPRYIPLPPYEGFVKYLTNYSENMDKTINNIQEIDKTKTVNYEKISQKTTAELNDKLDLMLSETKSKTQATEEKLNTTFEKSISKINENGTNFNLSNKSALDKNYEDLSKNISKLNEDISKESANQKINLQEFIDKIPPNFGEKFTELLGEQRNNLNGFQTTISKETGNILVDLKQEIGDYLRKFDTEVNNLKNQNKEMLSENEKNFQGLLKDTNTILNEVLSTSINETNTLVQDIKTSSSNSLNTLLEKQKNSANKTKSDIVTNLSGLQDSISQKLSLFQTSMVEKVVKRYSEAKTQFEQKYDEMKINLNKVIMASSEDIINKFTTIEDVLTKSVASIEDQLDDGKQVLTESIKTKLNTQTNQIAEFTENFLNKFKEMSATFQSEIIEDISNKITQVNTSTKDSMGQFSQELDNAKISVQELFQMKETENIAVIDESKTTLDNEYNSWADTLKNQVETTTIDCSTTISDNLKNSQTSISQSSSELIEDMSNAIHSTTSTITQKIDSYSGQHINKANTRLQETESKIKNIESIISEKISTQITSSETNLAEIVSINNSIGEEHINKLNQQLENLKAMFNTNIESQLTGMNNYKDKSIEILLEKGNLFKDTINSTIDSMQTNLSELVGKPMVELRGTIDSMLVEHSKTTSDIINNLNESIKSTNTTAVTGFKELDGVFEESVKKIKNGASDSINSGKQVLDEELGKVFESALKTIREVKDLGDQPIKIMNDAWEMMTSIDITKAEKTWPLVTEESIYPYIRGMIETVKGKLVIVVPDVDDLPLDLLLSKRARMTIVTNFNGKLSDEAEKLKEKGAMIMDYGGKDFIAVNRDDEELLFAPISAKDKPVTAIVSEVEPMINIVGSMITDYWRRMAKKL